MSRIQSALQSLQKLSPTALLSQVRRPSLPPGPGRFPYFSFDIAREAQRNPLRTFLDFYDRFGPVFTTRVFHFRQVWLIGPEANAYILLKNHKNFSWRDGHLGDLIPFLGDGLLTTDGHTHDRARRLMQPLFRKDRMQRYVQEMLTRTQNAISQLRIGQELELYHWTRELALQIATQILFGMDTSPSLCKKLSVEFERGLDFYGALYHLQFLRGPKTPYARMLKARKNIDTIIFEEIQRRRRRASRADNILDLLLNAKDGQDSFSDQEVRDQLVTLLFAGHDTTTATVSWMFTLLGQHRHVYGRLQDEIDQTFADAPLQPDAIMGQLPYLEQVLAETLRLYPAAWIGPRRAIDAFEFGGYRIPAGTPVAYSSWLTHRLPHVFPDPDMFDPERFTPEKIRALPPGAYVPFGWGPRLCIGKQFGELEIKAIVSSLLQHFHLELMPGQLFPARTVPTISPKHGVRVRVKPRSAPTLLTQTPAPPAHDTASCPVSHAS